MLGVALPVPVEGELHERAEPLLAFAQRLLGLLALGAVLRFTQCAAYRAHDPREALFQHVVRGSELEGLDRQLLAEHSGNEDERHIRRSLRCDLQRRHAVEGRERIVREDQVQTASLERRDEVLAGLHARNVAGDPAYLEHVANELGVPGVVLEVQHAKRAIHFSFSWRRSLAAAR